MQYLVLLASVFLFVAPARADSLDSVQSKVFTTRNFTLESGTVLPELTLAYETYGTLAPDGQNAALITHGYTSSHHAAGRYAIDGAPPGHQPGDIGSWDKLIGPGKAIDTRRLFVVSSNMLGSSYGSTSPRSINPTTGRRWGPDFPHISVADIVRAQKLLLDSLGVTNLVAVAGPSYGGYQAFQWGITFPNFLQGVVAVETAPKADTTFVSMQWMADQLAADPNWNGVWYYEKTGAIGKTMVDIRVAMLKRAGIEAQLKAKYPDRALREAAIVKSAAEWAQVFDGHSLIVLRRALEGFDAQKEFSRIKARVLYVLSRTDQSFPPTIAPGVMNALKAAGVDARYVEIDSEKGHLASRVDAEKWAADLRKFMAELMDRS